MNDDPERLPPPPFWRTHYFALSVLVRRPYLDVFDIQRILGNPQRRDVQRDGRVRLFGWSDAAGGYLRVVLLSDGMTVHNAFLDEDYEP
jgi:hypothetical protein